MQNSGELVEICYIKPSEIHFPVMILAGIEPMGSVS